MKKKEFNPIEFSVKVESDGKSKKHKFYFVKRAIEIPREDQVKHDLPRSGKITAEEAVTKENEAILVYLVEKGSGAVRSADGFKPEKFAQSFDENEALKAAQAEVKTLKEENEKLTKKNEEAWNKVAALEARIKSLEEQDLGKEDGADKDSGKKEDKKGGE